MVRVTLLCIYYKYGISDLIKKGKTIIGIRVYFITSYTYCRWYIKLIATENTFSNKLACPTKLLCQFYFSCNIAHISIHSPFPLLSSTTRSRINSPVFISHNLTVPSSLLVTMKLSVNCKLVTALV